MEKPTLIAVCRSRQRSDPKTDVGEGELQPGWGLVDDSHAGPARPGRWEISLLAWENVERLNQELDLGAVPGALQRTCQRGVLTPRACMSATGCVWASRSYSKSSRWESPPRSPTPTAFMAIPCCPPWACSAVWS